MFVFVTVTLDMLALGMVIPVLPKLVVSFVGGDTARGAEIYGLFGTAWAVMQFIASPVQGALSDRFGRRKVILASNTGLGLDYVLMALAPTLPWLFLGRVISGATSASISTAFAYIADTTPAATRAGSMGKLGMAFAIGFVLGPALGGLLVTLGPRVPFWAAAGLSLANALYGFFILPESLPPERRAAFSWRRANPLGTLKLLRTHDRLPGLAAVYFIYQLSHAVLSSTFVLYVSYRYAWDEETVGLTLALVGVCSGAVQGGLVGKAVARFGERAVLLAGLLFGVLGFALFGSAATGALFVAAVPVFALWGLAGPTMQSLMTDLVAATEQGRLQGANSSLLGIAAMIGPGLFTQSFALSIGADSAWSAPGAPFFLGAVLLAAGAVIAWRTTADR